MTEPQNVNTVGWAADKMQEHVFDCHQRIRKLLAERDELRRGIEGMCEAYCKWYDHSKPSLDYDIAYHMVSQARQLLAVKGADND